MALPTYEEIMLPLLRHLADGRQHSYADVVPLLQRDFRLSKQDLAITVRGRHTLPSQPTCFNKTYPQRLPEFRSYLQRSKEKRR